MIYCFDLILNIQHCLFVKFLSVICMSCLRMGIDQLGQVCVMIHSGSRGLGHQVATDSLTAMEAAMMRDGIVTNDRQLACAKIHSKVALPYAESYTTKQ